MLRGLSTFALWGGANGFQPPPPRPHEKSGGKDFQGAPNSDVTDPYSASSNVPPTTPPDDFASQNVVHDTDPTAKDIGTHGPKHPDWRHDGIPEPIHYIPATCEELCADQCTGTNLHHEVDQHYVDATRAVDSMVPNAIYNGVAAVGHYFKDIAQSIIPGLNLFNHEKKTVTSKNLLKKNGECEAKCETEVAQCDDHVDVADSVPQHTERHTIKPAREHCIDLAKLRVIAETGNLRWSLRFGQAPTFGQIARLAHPMDAITKEDLASLHQCAEGGEYAAFDEGAAVSLGRCMAQETKSLTERVCHGIQQSGAATDPTMNCEGVNPLVDANSGNFHMTEDIFYANDVRCFAGCAGLVAHNIMKDCEEHGHCASDYAELVWRTGALYSDLTVQEAMADMGYQHAHDPAMFPPSEAERNDTLYKNTDVVYGNMTAGASNHDQHFGSQPATNATTNASDMVAPPAAGSNMPPAGSNMPTAGSNMPPAGSKMPPAGSAHPLQFHLKAKKFLKAVQKVKKVSMIRMHFLQKGIFGGDDPTNVPPTQDPTHPSFAPPHQQPSPFCQAQMCAPYPATWVKGDLMAKLVAEGHLDACPVVDPNVPDSHPNDMYDGTMSEPEPPPTTSELPPPPGSSAPPASGGSSAAASSDVNPVPSNSPTGSADPAPSAGSTPPSFLETKDQSSPREMAKEMAIARRKRSWAWTAMRAAGAGQ